MITAEAIFDDWPGVAARIVTRLRRMGAERMNAEDLASEAVTKALTKGVSFESAEHFFNWTMLVARNLYVDQRRAASRAPDVCAIEDLDVPTHDTAVIAEHRMQLRRVLDVMSGMSAADRAAVMTDATPADRKDAVRLNVRRHRARARLRAALAGIAGLFGLRRLPRAGVATTPVAFATVLVTIALPFARTPLPAESDRGAAPAPTEQVTRSGAGHRPASSRTSTAPVAAKPKAVAPRPRRVAEPARAGRGGPREPIAQAAVKDKASVETYAEPNGPNEHLVCVTNSRVGDVCLGRPLKL